MNRLRSKASLWSVPALGVAAVLLAAGACGGEPGVATRSTLSGSAASRKPAAYPSKAAKQSPRPTAKPATAGSPGLDGSWTVQLANHRLLLKLTTEDQGVRGFVQDADGSVAAVRIGVFSGDAFLFETSAGLIETSGPPAAGSTGPLQPSRGRAPNAASPGAAIAGVGTAASGKSGWLWSGEVSSDGLHGHREDVQTGVVEEFTAQRLQ